MLPLLNFTPIVGLICRLLVFYVNFCHCLLVRELSYTIIVLGLASNLVGYLLLASQKFIFSPFTSSYKNFKGGFFKILIEKARKNDFYDGNVSKFSHYWTCSPLKFNSWSYHSMNAENRHVLSVLGHLSQKISTRALLQLYTSRRPQKDFIGI